MPTIAAREAAFAAIAARLATLLAETVERNRDTPVAEADMPCLVLLDGDHSVEDGDAAQTVTYRLTAQLAGYLSELTLAETMAAANDLHARAIGALVCNSLTGGAPQPIPVGAANEAELWIEEIGLRVDPASVAESEAPMASFVLDIQALLRLPEGAPFVTS
jgi:hypothetical protein